MTGISSAITVLSCSLFVAGLVKMLIPAGSTEKILRLVISMFVLICIVVCFKTIYDSIDISSLKNSVNSESEEIYEQNVLRVTGEYMAEYVKGLLDTEKITPEKIEVTVNTDSDFVINITDISIYLDKDNKFHESKIIEIIEADLKITPNLIIKE